MSLIENYNIVKKSIPQDVKLVVVSKTKSVAEIMEIYREGQKIFGENKVQELIPKFNELPKDIEWHFIGHLQSNKVKSIIPFVSLIHSVDSLSLLMEINKEAAKIKKVISCLLEFHIASEESKFGLDIEKGIQLAKTVINSNLVNVNIVGVMGMATFTSDVEQIKAEFANLKSIYNRLKNEYFANDNKFKEISMGMSDDYLIAIEQGSTMVRIGSAIFGQRNYH